MFFPFLAAATVATAFAQLGVMTTKVAVLTGSLYAVINASFELYPALVEERLRKQLNKAIRNVPDEHFAGMAVLVAFVKAASSILEQASRDKIVKFIEEGPGNDVLALLEPLSQIEDFRPAVQKRVDGLTLDELTEAINTHGIRALAKERAFHFLAQIRSWDGANDVFGKAVLPLFSSLSVQDIERVIRMPTDTGADLPGHTRTNCS